jgi:hypothetical protein
MPETTGDRCITPSFSPSTYHRGKLMDGEAQDIDRTYPQKPGVSRLTTAPAAGDAASISLPKI